MKISKKSRMMPRGAYNNCRFLYCFPLYPED